MDASIEELRLALEREGKGPYFEVFRLCTLSDGPGVTYRDAARTTGVSESDVKNRLTYCRASLRKILRGRIRGYVADDTDVERELEELLRG